MRIARSASALRAARAAMPGRVAFVPTMGCLHEGHMALVRRAKALADHVVVSIYVNPLQFGPQEDYQAYPRTPEEDAAKLRAEGVDVLFMPETLYPEGEPEVRVRAGKMSEVLCGAYRPGHFDGVLTVVAILFHLVRPDLAVFGEKDWQQLVLIRRMVRDLAWGIEVIGVPTVREPDGLA
ncbi:MAG: pantoate--beta-alanine ligase, partial [Zetaproteobacteria bacterium]